MGLFTDRGKSVPRAKSWSSVTLTPTANFATTVPCNPSSKMSLLSKFFDFVHFVWNPFSPVPGQNHLLQTSSKFTKEIFSSGFEDNSAIIDSYLCSLSNEYQDYKLGFSLLKSLEFENLPKSMVKLPTYCHYEDRPFIPNILNCLDCDIVYLDPKMEQMLLQQQNFKCDKVPLRTTATMESQFPKELHITAKSTARVNKVLKSQQEMIVCARPIINVDVQGRIVKAHSTIQVIPKPVEVNQAVCIKTMVMTSNSTTLSEKGGDCSMDTLNQELTMRKSKKMSKLSKKRRRRQRKKNLSSGNPDKNIKTSVQQHKNRQTNAVKHQTCSFEEVDNFHIIFEDDPSSQPQSLNSSFNISVTTDDFFVEFQCEENQNEDCFVNPALSFILGHTNSESEDDSDSSCTNIGNSACADQEFEIEDCFIARLSSMCFVDSSSVISVIDLTEMSNELKDINYQWQEATFDVPSKPKSPTKVSFAPDGKLVDVFHVEAYERKGEWETFALERFRFKRRIDDADKILSPCLTTSHRNKVWRRLQAGV